MNILDYVEESDTKMLSIKNIINRKEGLRSLSDAQFNNLVDRLAEELKEVDYSISHSDISLAKDWKSLKSTKSKARSMASTKRVGMKLVEHFFPNVWEVQNNKGQSFHKYWNDVSVLKKVLGWNRKSHTTPYLSELRRGVYFCTNLPKTTMYRPLLAKTIFDVYKVKSILDPCAGWGGRLLGACADPKRYYVGFEPNTDTYANIIRLTNHLKIPNCKIIHDGAENISKYGLQKDFDCILTSPPYFDVEVYSDEKTQSIVDKTYGEWIDNWLKPVIVNSTSLLKPKGISCWNVADSSKYKLVSVITDIHTELGFKKIDQFSLVSSSRQVNKTKKKKEDVTMVFRKS
jgi:16S rRNA G966 N2-methylase RsmD